MVFFVTFGSPEILIAHFLIFAGFSPGTLENIAGFSPVFLPDFLRVPPKGKQKRPKRETNGPKSKKTAKIRKS